jgi:UDP-N-acetylglucosamine 3-dehydrogenase
MLQQSIAVIGAGYWGKKVAREVLELSRTTGAVKLHSIVDSSPATLEQCRREFDGVDLRLDYKSLLEDPELSGVHICTPNATHFEVASAFLKRGKNALVEKPLTLTSIESLELVRLAQQQNVVLCIGHIHRFNNGVKELKRAVGAGVLGRLYYLRLEWTGFLPPQLEREVITDLAPHPFDICNYLLGEWPVKITCKGNGYRTKQNEEVAFIDAEYADGLHAMIILSWLDPEKHRDLTVVGSDGTAHLDCSTQNAILYRENKVEPVRISPSNTLGSEIAHFADCISHNQHSESFSNQNDGLLGAQVVGLLETARESLRQERTLPVRIPILEKVVAA